MTRLAIVGLTVTLLVGAAQSTSATPQQANAGAAEKGDAAFSQEELDQMLAPLALYPDALLSQIFMASTYPLEVIEADRWVKAHPELKGDAAAKDLEAQRWDASVKSLVNFADVLHMLSDKLDWMQKIGDAFLGQQKAVLATVQKLRAKAKAQGNLESTKEQKVGVEQEGATEIIVIESSSPDEMYVPGYDSAVVYGTWWYPAYPPYPYYPPYVDHRAGVSFAAGVAIGFAWGYAWGHCDWRRGDINVNINQNRNVNQHIKRDKYSNYRSGQEWRHDSRHRGDVGYRDEGTARQFGGKTTAQVAQNRQAYRGRPDTPNGAGANRGGAFDDFNRGGNQVQQHSDRGRESRGTSGVRPSSGGRGGGGRGGGGRR